MVFLQAGANPSGPSGACFASVRAGMLALITTRQADNQRRIRSARTNRPRRNASIIDQGR